MTLQTTIDRIARIGTEITLPTVQIRSHKSAQSPPKMLVELDSDPSTGIPTGAGPNLGIPTNGGDPLLGDIK